MIYFQLFYEFFKIGLFALGGGLATLPFLYNLAAKYPWFDASMLPNMIAVSESTPGPIGVNMATYAGYSAAGISGGIVATLGLVTPSIIIIMIIAGFLNKFQENLYVKSAFYGLRPAVTALIAIAGFCSPLYFAMMLLFQTVNQSFFSLENLIVIGFSTLVSLLSL